MCVYLNKGWRGCPGSMHDQYIYISTQYVNVFQASEGSYKQKDEQNKTKSLAYEMWDLFSIEEPEDEREWRVQNLQNQLFID